MLLYAAMAAAKLAIFTDKRYIRNFLIVNGILMKNTQQQGPTGQAYRAPAIKTVRLSFRQSILTGSNEDNINSIQEYDLEQGEW